MKVPWAQLSRDFSILEDPFANIPYSNVQIPMYEYSEIYTPCRSQGLSAVVVVPTEKHAGEVMSQSLCFKYRQHKAFGLAPSL
jgi:hypothetical protein